MPTARIAQQSIFQMGECLGQLMVERRRDPRSSLTSYLVQLEDEHGQLNEVELLAILIFFLFAGYETTTDLVGNGLLAFLRNPDQMRQLCEDTPH